jgi:hypothetical protein
VSGTKEQYLFKSTHLIVKEQSLCSRLLGTPPDPSRTRVSLGLILSAAFPGQWGRRKGDGRKIFMVMVTYLGSKMLCKSKYFKNKIIKIL